MTALGAAVPRTPFLSLPAALLLFFSLALLAPSNAHALEQKVMGDVTVPEGESVPSVSTAYGNVLIQGEVEEDVRSGFGNIEVEGPVGGDVEAGFGDVRVSSRVGEDVKSGYGNVELGPDARVGGDVFVGGGVVDDRGANVVGNFHTGMAGDPGDEDSPLGIFSGLVGWGLMALGLAAAAVLLVVAAPGPLRASVRSLEGTPGRALLVGAGSFPAMVVGSVLLAFTGVGLLLLPFAWPAYLALVVFGTLVAVYFVGRKVVLATGRYRAGDALAAVVGALLVSTAYRLPVLGGLILALLAALGTGAAVFALLSRRRRPRTPRDTYASYEEYLEARRDA